MEIQKKPKYIKKKKNLNETMFLTKEKNIITK